MSEYVRIAGVCPMGCGRTLFLGSGGHVTCSFADCPRPTAVDDLLHISDEHYVVFGEEHFTVEHTIRERLEGTMHDCPLHAALSSLAGPPVPPGRYRATPRATDGYSESYRSGAIGWDFDLVEEAAGG